MKISRQNFKTPKLARRRKWLKFRSTGRSTTRAPREFLELTQEFTPNLHAEDFAGVLEYAQSFQGIFLIIISQIFYEYICHLFKFDFDLYKLFLKVW